MNSGEGIAFSLFIAAGLFFVTTSGVAVLAKEQYVRIFSACAAVMLVPTLFVSGSQQLLLSTGLLSLMTVALLYRHTRRESLPRKRYYVTLALAVLLLVMGVIGPRALLPHDTSLFPPQEVRPSFSVTTHVTLLAFADDPVRAFIGSGPNSFGRMWDAYMPEQVAQSPFWDTDFTHGANTFSTLLVEFGIPATLFLFLSIVSLLAFLLRRIFVHRCDRRARICKCHVCISVDVDYCS